MANQIRRNLGQFLYSHASSTLSHLNQKYTYDMRDICGAKQLLCNMLVRGLIPDMVTYCTLIQGYCKANDLENALGVYNDMKQENMNPNIVVYNVLLDGLSKVVSVDARKRLLDALELANLYDVGCFNTMLKGYCMSGNIEEAFGLLVRMKKKGISFNQVTYNILICYLCKIGLIHEARSLLDRMFDEGIRPDCVTYTILIKCLSRNNCPVEVLKLHDYMLLRGVPPDSSTYKSIVSPIAEVQNIDTSCEKGALIPVL